MICALARDLIGPAVLACFLTASAAGAQQAEPRTLAVPATETWRHAATGMSLPAQVSGLTRSSIRDNTNAELDVYATYANRDEGVFALVYLYRTMTPSVPLWFDRALATIMLPQQGAAPPVVAPFTRPGASAATGLRTVTTDPNPRLTSTTLAIAPLGPNWLVKIRLGTNRLDPAALDQRLSAFIAALPWPAEARTAYAAIPILPCATPLRLRPAQVVAHRTEDSLIDSVAGSMSLDQEASPPTYCREPGATIERGVYRPDGATDAYVIALNDAGIAVDVGQMTDVSDLLGEGRGRPRFGVTVLDRASFSAYPSFNRLPPPDQVLETVRGGPGPFTTTTAPDRGNR